MTQLLNYISPLGTILLASDGAAVTGLWFEGQKYDRAGLPTDAVPAGDTSDAVLRAAAAWLDAYFSGSGPGEPPPLRPAGTAFQRRVWDTLRTIPYGRIVSYGTLARQLGTSARALGAAVGRNPISLMIPCHRVVGADGSLTGYAGGVERKYALLQLEKAL